jgi:hypothetical protein
MYRVDIDVGTVGTDRHPGRGAPTVMNLARVLVAVLMAPNIVPSV